MRVMNFFVRAIRASKEDIGVQSERVSRSDDSRASRRALLTGGLALAGASTLASTAKAANGQAAKLGVANTATATTFVTNTNANGTGLTGVANSGASATGIRGNSNSGTGVKGTSTSGIGVLATSTSNEGINATGGYAGLRATGGTYGVIGYTSGSGTTYGFYTSGSAYGLYANGVSRGVYATSSSGYGVYAASSSSYGVYGVGVIGLYATGSSYGVYANLSGGGGHAVHGQGGQYAVYGAGGGTAGVRGDSAYVGVWGEGATYGANVVATATSGQNFAIYAETRSSTGFAGYFKGNVAVAGTLSKTAGSFRIDHPLDPEHKWLQHSFVESPDMMNVYNGNVTTNANGLAVVKLPAYFGALNRDFRYQLTVIGKMAQAIIDQKVVNNQFRIRTDQGNVEVSWQVTGIRQDDYAKEHPIVVELAKSKAETGSVQFLAKGKTGRQMRLAPSASDSAPGTPEAP